MADPTNRSLATNPSGRLSTARRALALACALLALTASTAAARPQRDYTAYSAGATPAPTTVRIYVPSGFDWGDAGIGAAAGVGISLTALGGALAVSRRRQHETPTSVGAIG